MSHETIMNRLEEMHGGGFSQSDASNAAQSLDEMMLNVGEVLANLTAVAEKHDRMLNQISGRAESIAHNTG